MTHPANKAANTSIRDDPSATMAKTYWRMRLYRILRERTVLDAVESDGGTFRFSTMSWDQYWTGTPQAFRDHLEDLRDSWLAYIGSGFRLSCAAPYASAYLGVIRAVLEEGCLQQRSHLRFLCKVLGFENFVLKSSNAPTPFAAATASFRNPVFLSLAGMRKNNRNDPHLLPLVVGIDGDHPELYFHYRKQCLLKNTDDNVLIFPLVDTTRRQHSFKGLSSLTGGLFSEWDSRIDSRSRLLTEKVLIPLLRNAVKEKRADGQDALRILDIGSGAGLFTRRIVSRLLQSDVLDGREIELSLLDIIPAEPERYFSTPVILSGLARLEYISSDYMKWLNRTQTLGSRRFDLVFLFRILHNFSAFGIHALSQAPETGTRVRSRYRFFPHLSDYYRAISLVFPKRATQMPDASGDRRCFYPARTFNPLSLVTPDDRSLIQRLAEISSSVLIEDGDLLPEALIHHLSRYAACGIKVHDLSQALRLSINHVYWISDENSDTHPGGKMIWPH